MGDLSCDNQRGMRKHRTLADEVFSNRRREGDLALVVFFGLTGVVLVGALLGGPVADWYRTANPTVQGAAIGATVGVIGASVGGVVGALGAYIVARMNREEARQARFASRLRELTLQVMDDVIEMGLELVQQVAARAGTGQPVDTSSLPKVRDTIAIRRAMLELDLTARSQAVSDAADELVQFLEQLRDEFAYLVPRDTEIRVRPNRQVLAKPLPSSAGDDLQGRLTQLNEPYRRFQNAVRHDLGLPPLVETGVLASDTRPDAQRQPSERGG